MMFFLTQLGFKVDIQIDKMILNYCNWKIVACAQLLYHFKMFLIANSSMQV